MSQGKFKTKVIIRTSIGSQRPLHPQHQHIGDFTEALDKSFIDSNKDLIWTNGRSKGYVELNVFSEYVDVKFNFVSSVKSKNYKNLKPITFKVNHSEAIS